MGGGLGPLGLSTYVILQYMSRSFFGKIVYSLNYIFSLEF